MKRSQLALAGIAVVTLLFMGLAALSQNDPRAIRKMLSAVASDASVDPKQGLFVRQAHGTRLRDRFTAEVALKYREVSTESVRGRAELMEYITAARSSLQQASLRFTQVQIEISKDRNAAVVRTVLEGDLNGEKNALRDELTLALQKIDHRWVIDEIEASVPATGR